MNSFPTLPQLVFAMGTSDTQTRSRRLTTAHVDIIAAYFALLTETPPAVAQRPLSAADPRSLSDLVAVQIGWSRFSVLAGSEVMIGVRRPRMLTSLSGYVDEAGQSHAFPDAEAFEDFCLQENAHWSWAERVALAVDTSDLFYHLFTNPGYSRNLLDETAPIQHRFPNGREIATTMGWSLWLSELTRMGAVWHLGRGVAV